MLLQEGGIVSEMHICLTDFRAPGERYAANYADERRHTLFEVLVPAKVEVFNPREHVWELAGAAHQRDQAALTRCRISRDRSRPLKGDPVGRQGLRRKYQSHVSAVL